MLDDKQIAEIERQMREEHKREVEALEALKRLRRYLPDFQPAPDHATRPPSAAPKENGSTPHQRGRRTGLKDEILAVIDESTNQTWTRPMLQKALRERGFEIQAKDPVAAMNQALRKLVIDADVTLLKQGSGSALAEYCSLERQILSPPTGAGGFHKV
jgi:hypothetical protein